MKTKSAPIRATPAPTPKRPLPQRLAVGAGVVVVAFAVGFFAAFAHAQRVGVVPVGLVVALVGPAGVVLAAGALTRTRGTAGLATLGWLISVAIFASPRPEGDLVVSGDWRGAAYLLGGLVLLGGLCALPYGRLRREV